MSDEQEKAPALVGGTVKALYVLQALTAATWLVCTVLASIAFMSANGNDRVYVLAMVTCVVLLVVQQVCISKLRSIRDKQQNEAAANV